MLDNQHIQNNWPQIKSEVLTKWSKLSESDVESTHGEAESLHKLVQSKYPNSADFDKAYDQILKPFLSQSGVKNDIEDRDPTLPSAEAGMPKYSTERRLNANYAKVENEQNDEGLNEEQKRFDSDKENMQFTTPDEFYPSQDPTPSREDITLGRNTSSATKLSTAKAAPKSSEVSFNDAKKKL